MRRLTAILLENWNLKVLALLLAVILWNVVRGDPGGERVITVPLEVRIPRNMEITSERPGTVDVIVRGTFTNAFWFGQQIPACIVDLYDSEEGEQIVALSPDNVRLPRGSGLDVIAVRPARISFMLEATISKEVPIRVPIKSVPSGMEVYYYSTLPETILITGPRSHVEPVREVFTETVTLNDAENQRAVRKFPNLNIKDNSLHTSPAGPVEVNFQVGPRRIMRTVSNIPVVPQDQDLSVTPTRISAQVLVPVTYKGKLTPDDLSAAIPAGALPGDETSVRVKPAVTIKNPSDPAMVIKGTEPSQVTIRRKGK